MVHLLHYVGKTAQSLAMVRRNCLPCKLSLEPFCCPEDIICLAWDVRTFIKMLTGGKLIL